MGVGSSCHFHYYLAKASSLLWYLDLPATAGIQSSSALQYIHNPYGFRQHPCMQLIIQYTNFRASNYLISFTSIKTQIIIILTMVPYLHPSPSSSNLSRFLIHGAPIYTFITSLVALFPLYHLKYPYLLNPYCSHLQPTIPSQPIN